MKKSDAIELSSLTGAIERCCDACPASGEGSRLHPDAALMATLLGRMIHHKATRVPVSDVAQEIQNALARWS